MAARSRIAPRQPKADPKSLPGPSRDAPGRPGASQERPGGVSGASREVPGASRERPEGPQERPGTPRGAPRSDPERAETAKIGSKSRPGVHKASFVRSERSRSGVEAIFHRFLRFFGFSGKSAKCLKYCACQQKQRFGPSRCEACRSCHATSKSTANQHENRPRIVENPVSGPLVRHFRSTFVARSGSVERLGATRSDSGRNGAAKGARLGVEQAVRAALAW